MGKLMVTKAKHAKRSSAKLMRSVLLRRKIEATKQLTADTAPNRSNYKQLSRAEFEEMYPSV